MVPKVGDLVRMNPEYIRQAGTRNDPLSAESGFLTDLWIWGMGDLRVSEVLPSPTIPGYVSVRFEETWHSVGIWIADGRFYASPVGSPPLFLLAASSGPEPRNNDGRQECFWCSGTRTQKRGGGLYDVCPKCGR